MVTLYVQGRPTTRWVVAGQIPVNRTCSSPREADGGTILQVEAAGKTMARQGNSGNLDRIFSPSIPLSVKN